MKSNFYKSEKKDSSSSSFSIFSVSRRKLEKDSSADEERKDDDELELLSNNNFRNKKSVLSFIFKFIRFLVVKSNIRNFFLLSIILYIFYLTIPAKEQFPIDVIKKNNYIF